MKKKTSDVKDTIKRFGISFIILFAVIFIAVTIYSGHITDEYLPEYKYRLITLQEFNEEKHMGEHSIEGYVIEMNDFDCPPCWIGSCATCATESVVLSENPLGVTNSTTAKLIVEDAGKFELDQKYRITFIGSFRNARKYIEITNYEKIS